MKEGKGEGEREEEEGEEEVEMEEEEGMERYSCYEFIELRQDFSKETSSVTDIWLRRQDLQVCIAISACIV